MGRAIEMRARTSFGKATAAVADAGEQEREADAAVVADAAADVVDVGARFSQRLAISLMKLILVASMALATYLVISALSGDMTRNGFSVRRNGVYSSCSTSPTSGRRTPTTTRSGFMKSSMAAPSLRNSGIAGDVALAAGEFFEPGHSLALVPTGTVLLMTTGGGGGGVGLFP